MQGTAEASTNQSAGNATLEFSQSGTTQITLVHTNRGNAPSVNSSGQGYSLHGVSFVAGVTPVSLASPGDQVFTQNHPIGNVNLPPAEGGASGDYFFNTTPTLPTGLSSSRTGNVLTLSGTASQQLAATTYTATVWDPTDQDSA